MSRRRWAKPVVLQQPVVAEVVRKGHTFLVQCRETQTCLCTFDFSIDDRASEDRAWQSAHTVADRITNGRYTEL